MRFSSYIREVMCVYKIEKYDEKYDCWRYYASYINQNEARILYNEILKNERGIFRMIKIMEIDEL